MSSMNRIRALGCAVAASAIAVSTASAQVEAYSQNFEGMDLLDTAALSSDGWIGSVNVFDEFYFTYLYGYFGFPAPNDPGFLQCSVLVTGEGDAAQGDNQLAVFSDYTNGDHTTTSNVFESYIYREYSVTAANVGQTLTFTFDAKHGDVGGLSQAFAFFKTLDPAAGWATIEWPTMDLTTIPSTWDTYSMSFPITEAHVGLQLQFGFYTVAANNEPSTNYYDNINLTGPPPPCAADMNGDGLLDNGDISAFVQAFLAGCD